MTTTNNSAARSGVRLSLDQDGLGVYEDDQGDYVLFTDYDFIRNCLKIANMTNQDLLKERDALRSEVHRLRPRNLDELDEIVRINRMSMEEKANGGG